MTRSNTARAAMAATATLLVSLSWISPTFAQTHSQGHPGMHPSASPPSKDSASPDGQHIMDADGGMRCGGAGHAQHERMLGRKDYTVSEHRYALSDAPLVDKNGAPTTLSQELGGEGPVIVTFVFTTCTTICPVLSGTFAQLQRELGPESGQVRMVSISIDPEYDTPERMRAYAARFNAGSQWHFLTGDREDIVAVQKSFDAYRGNKMSHEPIILLRRSPDAAWVRLNGLPSAKEVAKVLRGNAAATL